MFVSRYIKGDETLIEYKDDYISLYNNKRKNVKFYIFNSDNVIGEVIRKGNIWEGFMHEYFSKYSDKEKIALDIGANIGTHTYYLSKYYKNVHAFEPFVYDVLEKNIKINKINNVKIYKFGLSNATCKSKIRKVNTNIGSSYIDKDGDIDIRLHKLDEIYKDKNEKIGFMKIDVEGHELEVLEGAKETIIVNKPVIIIEIKNKKALDMLLDLGYKYKRISNEDYLCLPQKNEK